MTNEVAIPLSPGAQRLIERAAAIQQEFGAYPLGLHHFLLALLERHTPLANDLVPGWDGARYCHELEAKVQAGDAGAPLDVATVRAAVVEHARQWGKLRAYE